MEASAPPQAATHSSHYTMSSSMLKKLVEMRLGDECCSLKCKQEKENMRTAIMKLADAFNDIFDIYVAQDRMLFEIVKIANDMCNAFNLSQRFSLPNEGQKNRLYDMARMVRLYFVKNPQHCQTKRDVPTKSAASNSCATKEFSSPVKSANSGNASHNYSCNPGMRNGISHNKPAVLSKRIMPSHHPNQEQLSKRACASVDHNYSQPQALKVIQPTVRRSEGMCPTNQIERNNTKTWNPPVEIQPESNGKLNNGMPAAYSAGSIRLTPAMNGSRLPTPRFNNMLDPNFPALSKERQQHHQNQSADFSQHPLAQLQRMYTMPLQVCPPAGLPTISSTTSTTDCTAIKQQLEAASTNAISLQLVARMEEGPPGGCNLYILSGYQRKYLANVPILFGSDMYTNFHSLTLPRLRSNQVNKEVPEVASLNAKMQYDGGVCVVKLIVKYMYTDAEQRLFLYYYLTEAQAQGVGQWDNGKDFKCRETGTMTVTLQFEDITESEVLMLSFRLGSTEKGISPYSTPVALKLGEASSGTETNVDYEHFRQREREAQLGESRQYNSFSGDGVEIIDLED